MSLVVQIQGADTAAAADDPLLSYAVTTIPSPLKASPENPQVPEEPGELIFSATRQAATNQPADIEWIKVKVPAGTMAPDLATDLAKISPRISLDGWSARLDAVAKEFVFEPTGSHATIGPDTGFTIQLSDIPMSRKVGTAPITVTERSRTGNSAFQNRPIVFNIGKFPADFYLRNFLCEPSIIPNGGDVKLTWERSANATYELLYPGVDLDVTKRTSLDIEGIKSDTTFYIRATTGDPTNPAVRILSAQVSVIKPDLDIGNLTVNGEITLKGPLESPTLIHDFSNGIARRYYTAEGYGMLVSSGFNSNSPGSGIQFFPSLKANEVEVKTTIDPMDSGSTALLLRKGDRAEINVSYRGGGGEGTPGGFSGKLHWIPLGIG
ncbi:hypothetical protein P3T36_003039 [Kitasatospora sp. MAP12-15]|uniref:hypothetical protein n=1 Tax=unclassified Kitasatospora TaxID=2633591 RepID=UPI002474866E|nr:hypothetical protein [Kitasatospora sp. MAP12-44]MDH6110670.1 hypothetical protein [Kitasatospora sp. MAP12-44]